MDRLIPIPLVRVAGDDVPSVNEAWNITKTAERNIDKRVSCAEAAFDPYCR